MKSIRSGGEKNAEMPVYGPKFKEQIVKKMMPPHNQSVAQVSRDSGVAVHITFGAPEVLDTDMRLR